MPTDQKPPEDDLPTDSAEAPRQPAETAQATDDVTDERAENAGEAEASSTIATTPPLTYEGKSGDLFRLGLKVTVLTIITAGIYKFWGKTRIRQYLWGRLTLLGDRLTYTGTGRELFVGFLLAAAVLIPIAIVFWAMEFVLAGRSRALAMLPSIFIYVTIGYLTGTALYLARRYRLSRTIWRGIRFGQTGSALYYGLLYFGWLIARAATLDLINPVASVQLQRIRICNSWFGNRHFTFDGQARDLYKRWLLCWVLTPFTLGLSVLWYRFYELSYFVSRTGFEGVRFRLPLAKRDIVRVFLPMAIIYVGFVVTVAVLIVLAQWSAASHPIVNGISVGGLSVVLIATMLLGRALILSIVVHRFATIVASRLTMTGDVDLNRITQNMQALAGSGEGLASALDVGTGLDIGF